MQWVQSWGELGEREPENYTCTYRLRHYTSSQSPFPVDVNLDGSDGTAGEVRGENPTLLILPTTPRKVKPDVKPNGGKGSGD